MAAESPETPEQKADRRRAVGEADARLVARTLEGDQDAFNALIRQYWKTVTVICYQRTRNFADAEDIAQEAFVKAYSALASLRDHTRFGAWLYNISTKCCIDWIRRRGRDLASVSIDQMGEQRQEIAAPFDADELERRDLHQKVMAVVGNLPERYALVLTLRYVRRMSYREIAEHLDEPAGTVSNRIHRASEMLRRALKKEGAEPRAGSGRHAKAKDDPDLEPKRRTKSARSSASDPDEAEPNPTPATSEERKEGSSSPVARDGMPVSTDDDDRPPPPADDDGPEPRAAPGREALVDRGVTP